MPAHINPRLIEHDYVSVKQCRHGLFAYNVNDLYIGRSLDAYGEWGEAEVELLSQILVPGGVVVDVGANIGTHTVAFAKKVTASGGVIAFEPQPLLYQLLNANVALNALVHVRCHQAAVSDERGTLQIPVLDPSHERNFGGFQAEGHERGETIATMRIDDLGLPRCSLIKVDTEGMEASVLQSARQTISAHHPVLFVENNSEEHSPALLRLIDELGYTCWWHIAHYYNPSNYFANDHNLFSGTELEANLLCFPKDVRVSGGDLWPVEGLDDTFMSVLRRHST
jgi:FkbM family methyltransferase